jgi:hypothetical protein
MKRMLYETRDQSMLRFPAGLILLSVSSAVGLTVLPKPTSQVTNSDQFLIDPTAFTFNASQGYNGDILRDATKRYYAIMFGTRSTAADEAAATAQGETTAMLQQLLKSGDLTQNAYDRHVSVSGPSDSRRGFGFALSAGEAAAKVTFGTIAGCDINVATDVEVKTASTDESYKLIVKAPRITVEAPTVFGAM